MKLAWISIAVATLVASSFTDGVLGQFQDGQPKIIRIARQYDYDDKEPRMLTVEPKIVGGVSAGRGDFPFFAQFWNSDVSCGASLIHPDIVLTAAQCNMTRETAIVNVGAYDQESNTVQGLERQVAVSVAHPDFFNGGVSLDNDVRVLKLRTPVPITAIPLNSDPTIPVADELLTVIGLGDTSEGGSASTTLQEVNVNYIDPTTCSANYISLTHSGPVNPKLKLCAGELAGGKDACQGDGGGPLFTPQEVQVGIVSYGQGCAEANLPTIYTRVSAYYTWIRQQVCALSTYPPSYCFNTTLSPTNIRLDVVYDSDPTFTSYQVFDTYNAVFTLGAGTAAFSNKLVSESLALTPGYYFWRLADTSGTGFCCTNGFGYYAAFAVVNGLYQQLIAPTYASFTGSALRVDMPVPAVTRVTSRLQSASGDKKGGGGSGKGGTGKGSGSAGSSGTTIRVEVNYDNFPTETALTIYDSSNVAIASSGLGSASYANKLVFFTFQLSPGYYTFQFTDTFGDGFCCNAGIGYYAIYAGLRSGAYQALVPPTYPSFLNVSNVLVYVPPTSRFLQTQTNLTDVPSTPPTSMLANVCQNAPSKFSYVNAAKLPSTQTCPWLASNPPWKKALCQPKQKAYKTCPKTCAKCVDACAGKDSTTATFPINDINRTCAWLSTRSSLWPMECVSGQPAYSECKHVCNSCKT